MRPRATAPVTNRHEAQGQRPEGASGRGGHPGRHAQGAPAQTALRAGSAVPARHSAPLADATRRRHRAVAASPPRRSRSSAPRLPTPRRTPPRPRAAAVPGCHREIHAAHPPHPHHAASTPRRSDPDHRRLPRTAPHRAPPLDGLRRRPRAAGAADRQDVTPYLGPGPVRVHRPRAARLSMRAASRGRKKPLGAAGSRPPAAYRRPCRDAPGGAHAAAPWSRAGRGCSPGRAGESVVAGSRAAGRRSGTAR